VNEAQKKCETKNFNLEQELFQATRDSASDRMGCLIKCYLQKRLLLSKQPALFNGTQISEIPTIIERSSIITEFSNLQMKKKLEGANHAQLKVEEKKLGRQLYNLALPKIEMYLRAPPRHDPVQRICVVLVAAMKKWNVGKAVRLRNDFIMRYLGRRLFLQFISPAITMPWRKNKLTDPEFLIKYENAQEARKKKLYKPFILVGKTLQKAANQAGGEQLPRNIQNAVKSFCYIAAE